MQDESKNEQPLKWLAYRLSAMGDVVLLSGVLDWWHKTRGWRFTVMTRQAYAELFENHPAVEGIEPVNPEDIRGLSIMPRFRSVAARYAGYGLMDLHGSLRSRLLAMLWKGPVLRYPKYSLERRLFLRKRSPEISAILRAANVTQRYAMAARDWPVTPDERHSPSAACDCPTEDGAHLSGIPQPEALMPKIYLTAAEKRSAAERLLQIRRDLAELSGAADQRAELASGGTVSGKEDFFLTPHERPVILHPYATHERKQWPREHWLELIRLLDANRIGWIIVGQGQAFFPETPTDLTNATGLRELAAILGQGRLLVTGDSGPMHLGAAAGLPVLGLFGPTTREWGFFPAGSKDRVLELDMACRPCSLHGSKSCPCNGECLRGITPETVLRGIREMLQYA